MHVPQVPSSLILSTLHTLLSTPLFLSGVVLPLVLILADVVTGIGAALKQHVFSLDHLADFLSHDLVKYLTACTLLVCSYVLVGKDSPLTLAALTLPGILAVSIAASILHNVQLLFPNDRELTAFVGAELQKAVPQFQPAQTLTMQPASQQGAAQQQQVQVQVPSAPTVQSPAVRPQSESGGNAAPSAQTAPVSPYRDPAIINIETTPMPRVYPQFFTLPIVGGTPAPAVAQDAAQAAQQAAAQQPEQAAPKE